MKPSCQSTAAGLAISAYAGWNARNLLLAWVHSPYDRCDSLAFALWAAPIVYLWCAYPVVARAATERTAAVVFGVALALSFAGVVVDLSALKYLAFAVALAGFLPVQPVTLLWVMLAAAWMPAAGWALSSQSILLVSLARIAAGFGALMLSPSFIRHEPVR